MQLAFARNTSAYILVKLFGLHFPACFLAVIMLKMQPSIYILGIPAHQQSVIIGNREDSNGAVVGTALVFCCNCC